MVSELELTGHDLLIYAAIDGFTRSYDGFRGSAQYLADWCGTSKRSVFRNLQRMVQNGLLSKKDVVAGGVKTCVYRTLRKGQNVTAPSDMVSSGVVTRRAFGGDMVSPNTIRDTINNMITSSVPSPPSSNDLVFNAWESISKTGNLAPQMQRNFETYRAKGCADDLILFALERMQEAGSTNWAYAKKILDVALAGNCTTRAQFEAARKPWHGAGRNTRIDRETPSGNDFLQTAMTRPRRLKRRD